MEASAVGNGVCPAAPPRVSGTYDHFTLVSATPLANTLQLKGTRSHPQAVVLRMNARDECVNETSPPSTDEVGMMLPVQPTVAFGMPAAMGVAISKDGKSIVYVDRENAGWTWTFTPTGLR
jgi:hypothetical protein